MKVKITEKITEIECTAEELKQSNSVADGFRNLLRRTFNPSYTGEYSFEETEDDGENEE